MKNSRRRKMRYGRIDANRGFCFDWRVSTLASVPKVRPDSLSHDSGIRFSMTTNSSPRLVSGYGTRFPGRDLPSASEFAHMFAKGQVHYLALPTLAAIEEIDLDCDLQLHSSTIVCKRLALMLHFGMSRMNPDPWQKSSGEEGNLPTPAWYERLARNEPAVVAREFVRYARLRLRSGASLLWEVTSLDSEPNRSTIAASAAAPMLRMFPVRTSNAQLEVLGKLLALARRHCDRGEFEVLVQEKLRSRSMAIAQRVYWLTAAFLAVPTTYRSAFEDILEGNQLRIRRVVEFLWNSPEGQTSEGRFRRLRETDLAFLIEVLGTSYTPRTRLLYIRQRPRHISGTSRR